MRLAKSYSIVDHQLLHGGYFHQLSHQALALYLFLVVVGDCEGRSFYAERTIASILRFSSSQMARASDELISQKLIYFRRPYWWVRSLTHSQKKFGSQTERTNSDLVSLRDLLKPLASRMTTS